MTVRLAPLSVLALGLALASGGPGCGGRSLSTPPADGGAAGQGSGTAGGGGGVTGASGSGSGAAGSGSGAAGSSSGAAGATGGTTGAAGTGTAGTAGAGGHAGSGGVSGAGGHGGAGGGPACGPCPAIGCAQGFMSVVDPKVSCCPICRPINCATVDCANPNCPSDSHAETPPGMCCPVCVAGSSLACGKAQASYQQARKVSLEKYGAFPCKVDSDCELLFESNGCVSTCGVALEVSVAGYFDSNLSSLANDCDQSCPPAVSPPCAFLVAVCSNGLCTTAGAPLGLQ